MQVWIVTQNTGRLVRVVVSSTYSTLFIGINTIQARLQAIDPIKHTHLNTIVRIHTIFHHLFSSINHLYPKKHLFSPFCVHKRIKAQPFNLLIQLNNLIIVMCYTYSA